MSDFQTTDLYATIAAFADGEHVSPDALKRALAEEEGRDYLIDVLLLRTSIGEASPPFASPARQPRSRARALRVMAMAAGLVLAAATGYFAGQRGLEPALATPGTSLARNPGDANGLVAAPAPTRVIRLEPGVNWTDSSGGN